MSTPAPPPRLTVIFAREAHKAVIIRRGPASYARLSLWDTDTDMVEHGQWLRGRVYENKCDLSPDGLLFVYFALQEHERRQSQEEGYTGTYTAISRPPYFTALGLWVEHGTYTFGGRFIDNQTVFVGHECEEAHANHQPPGWLKCVGFDVIRDASPEHTAHYNAGWIADAPTNVKNPTWNIDIVLNAHKPDPAGRYVLERQQAHEYGDIVTIYALVDTKTDKRTEITGKVAQMDWDQRGRLICVSEGKLWARDPADPNAKGTLIEDFNGQTFEPIASPDWAKQW